MIRVLLMVFLSLCLAVNDRERVFFFLCRSWPIDLLLSNGGSSFLGFGVDDYRPGLSLSMIAERVLRYEPPIPRSVCDLPILLVTFLLDVDFPPPLAYRSPITKCTHRFSRVCFMAVAAVFFPSVDGCGYGTCSFCGEGAPGSSTSPVNFLSGTLGSALTGVEKYLPVLVSPLLVTVAKQLNLLSR